MSSNLVVGTKNFCVDSLKVKRWPRKVLRMLVQIQLNTSNIALSSNGRTPDFESGNECSNHSGATNFNIGDWANLVSHLIWDQVIMKVQILHLRPKLWESSPIGRGGSPRSCLVSVRIRPWAPKFMRI